jgi:hypothetical protein
MAKSQGLSGALTNYTPVLARTATMLDENFGEAHLTFQCVPSRAATRTAPRASQSAYSGLQHALDSHVMRFDGHAA